MIINSEDLVKLSSKLSQRVEDHFSSEDKQRWSTFIGNLKSKKFRELAKAHPMADEKLKLFIDNVGKHISSKDSGIQVLGSKGAVHTVKKHNDGSYTCSCPNWTYKGSATNTDCKHITQIKMEKTAEREKMDVKYTTIRKSPFVHNEDLTHHIAVGDNGYLSHYLTDNKTNDTAAFINFAVLKHPKHGRILEVTGMYVDPEKRGTGLGKQLWQQVRKQHKNLDIIAEPDPMMDKNKSIEELGKVYEGYGMKPHPKFKGLYYFPKGSYKEKTAGLWHDLSPLARRSIIGGSIGTVGGAGAGYAVGNDLKSTVGGGLIGGALGIAGGTILNKFKPIKPAPSPGKYEFGISATTKINKNSDYSDLPVKGSPQGKLPRDTNWNDERWDVNQIPEASFLPLKDQAGRPNTISPILRTTPDARDYSHLHSDTSELLQDKTLKSDLVSLINQQHNPNSTFSYSSHWLGKLDPQKLPKREVNLSYNGPIDFDKNVSPEMNEMKRLLRIGMKKKAEISTTLQPHQQRVVDKLQKQPGLVVAHGLGSGKTLSSIAAQDKLEIPATVVVPAALKANYEKERDKHIVEGTGQPFTMDSIQNVALKKKLPDNPMLIVDEAHRARDPQSSTFKALQKNNAEKRMLLTGSPFYNHPSDIAPLINLAANDRVLPQNKQDFEATYISEEAVKPNFINSLQGATEGVKPVLNKSRKKELQEVFNKWVDYHPGSEKGFPTVNRKDIEVPMTEKQLELYDSIVGNAPPWVASKIKSGLPPSKQESKDLNAYLSGARQVSNSTAPYITEGDPEHPKIQKAFEEFKTKLKENERMKAIIYSNYLDAGINPYKQMLDKEKIPYGVFSGEVNKKERDALIQQYNEDKIKALLLSSAGGEGLDLKGTRLIQVLEPHWNDEKLKQVEGRGIRFQSHDHLPENERNVLIQRYMATRPKSFWDKVTFTNPGMAVDQYLAARSKEKEELNQQFRDLFQKVAFLWSSRQDDKKSTISNEQAFQKAEEIKGIIGKKYNVTPFLTGSLRLKTNVPGSYDYDYNIHLNSKDKFKKLVRKFESQYEPSEYNKENTDHHIFKMNILGEEVDVGLTYGKKGREYQDSVRSAEQKLTDDRRKEIIKKKQDLQNAWFFKERRYKNFKREVDEELGIKRFGRDVIKEAFRISDSDVYGHRTNNLEGIIENGLLSAWDANKKGLLKSFESNHSIFFGRGRSESSEEKPKELKTQIFLTPGLLPPDATYGRYGVLFKKRKITPSPYVNTVPKEVITDKVTSKKMIFVVPKEELDHWKDKYEDHTFITESDVPEGKKLPARDYLEIPRRILAGGKFFHETRSTEKAAEELEKKPDGTFADPRYEKMLSRDRVGRTKEEFQKDVDKYRSLMGIKRPVETELGESPEHVVTHANFPLKGIDDNTVPATITAHPNYKEHHIAHELGHVKNFESIPSPMMQGYSTLRGLAPYDSHIAALFALASDKPLKPAIHNLKRNIPTLIDEGVASIRGYKALKKDDPEKAKGVAKDYAKSYSTYLEGPALPFAVAGGKALLRAGVNLGRDLAKTAEASVTPYQQQSQSSCSAACLKSVLNYYGREISELDVALEIGVKKNKGAETTDIVNAAKKLGFKAYEKSFTINEAKELTDKGIPIICDIQSFTKPGSGHYVVLTNIESDRIYLMDPNTKGNKRELSVEDFEKRWVDRAMEPPHKIMRHWGVVVAPKSSVE